MPECVVALEKALVGLSFGCVHEVHVLDPSLLPCHHGKPDAGEHVDEDEKEDRHHHNLQVDLDVLWKVRSLNRSIQPAQTEELEEAEGVEKVCQDCLFVAGDLE